MHTRTGDDGTTGRGENTRAEGTVACPGLQGPRRGEFRCWRLDWTPFGLSDLLFVLVL
jgi:hypothetical protein